MRMRIGIKFETKRHFTFIEALHDAGMTQKRKRFIAVSIKIHTWGDFLFRTCTQKTSQKEGGTKWATKVSGRG